MKLLLGIVLLVATPAWAGPVDGTWRSQLDKAKSESKPMELTLKDGAFKCAGCDANVSLDVKASGRDEPVSGTSDYDSVAVTTVDAHTVKAVYKKDKQVSFDEVDSVSADGKTLTRQFHAFPLKGAPIAGTLVYARAAAAAPGAHAVSGTWSVKQAVGFSDAALTVTYRSTGDGLSMTAGTGESYTASFGGPDVPLKNDRSGGTISIKKIDAATFEETLKHAGRPVQVNRVTAAGDHLNVISTDAQSNKLTLTFARVSK